MLRESTAVAVAIEPSTPAPAHPAAHMKPAWWDDLEDGPSTAYRATRSYTALRKIIKDYIEGKLEGRTKPTTVSGSAHHIYFTKKDGAELWLLKDNPAVRFEVCVAKKVNGAFVGNASAICAIKYKHAGKKRATLKWHGGEQRIQRVLNECMPMIPFRMYEENQLDVDTLKIIDRGQAEQIDVGWKDGRLRHYTGAMLFTLDVKPRSRGVQNATKAYFLFDVDRNDVKLKNFNAFLSKLSRPCDSIADAYASLKPQEVSDAERFLKKEVPRQGEWFFIPVVGEFENQREEVVNFSTGKRYRGLKHSGATLQSKGNRAHYVEKLSVEGYVKGKVSHGGHEHTPILLGGWHKPVPNTAVESFKVSGDID